ncbi:MAG: flagellar basal-body rod protein FlgF [Bdellovibrionales bacterium]
MESPSLVLMSNQTALQRALDVVANNVANANTTGFKRQGIQFDTLLSRPAPGESIEFVVDRATYRDLSNGPMQITENPLDIAISGPGYLPVQTPEGKRYTRAGTLQLNPDGQLVTQSGHLLLGDGDQPITIPNTVTAVNVSADGFVTAKVDNGTALSQVGKLKIAYFANEHKMQAMGNGLYSSDDAPIEAPAAASRFVQGAIEQSNVQPVLEITQMITIMRSYEQTVNLIRQQNQQMDDAIIKLSKTTV